MGWDTISHWEGEITERIHQKAIILDIGLLHPHPALNLEALAFIVRGGHLLYFFA
jgi:hypothetical protein